MLCLSGFELYSRWVPLTSPDILQRAKGDSGNVEIGSDTGFGKYLPTATREARFAKFKHGMWEFLLVCWEFGKSHV